MIHTNFFNGEVGRLLQLLVIYPKQFFEPHPCLLDCRHTIPLVNHQPELARPVDDHAGNVNCLQLGV